MKKYSFLLVLLATHLGFAQRTLTIQEATLSSSAFSVENLNGIKWSKNDNTVSYLDASYQNLIVQSAVTQRNETIATKSDIEKALKNALPNETFALKTFPYNYNWVNYNLITFTVASEQNKYIVEYNTNTKNILSALPYAENGTNAIVNASNSLVAWLDGNNIKITNAENVTKNVTNDADTAIVNGSDNTHRQEFGIDRGMWWSPTADKLLYYRKDESMVADYPLPQWDTRVATIKNTKYPMAGEKSEEVTLIVYDLKTDRKVTLKTDGDKEQYLTTVTWSPNGESVYVGVLNRGQDHLKLNAYDATTGNFIKTLFEEKLSTWVEPQHALLFVPNDAEHFIYQTDAEGFNQMYLYNTKGKLVRKLGFENVIVEKVLGFSKDGKSISYMGITNNGLDRQLFQVELKKGKTKQLTTEPGYHNASLSTDGTFLLDQYSNVNTPNVIQIINLKNKKTQVLVDAKNPFEGLIDMPKMELVEITAADGKTPLNGRIIYPLNYDANKKYPVMIYVYGGSHAQLVKNRWMGGASLFDYYMAQNDYVVFTVDNRGSDARGRDFTRVTHRNLGVNEMADQLKGVDYLKSLAIVDQNKIGVYGWSYGGFMTTSLLLNYNDIFKVGVAGGPVMDWKWYEAMYGERYMDTPQENPEGYAKTSTLNKVKDLKGDLLIIHGAQDPVVVQQHSMEFIEACIKAGIQVDYFLYPTHEHNVRGIDRVHLNTKIARYFDTYLKR
ncbi:DPP IV N-terminal domain-containing protein [Flavobacterium agricola]|uniref:DPP IV N-terminal domain-containing protein n=1 Tax=Flavobacterium agricola TaxID=2870839 RepID=A0ABY6M1D8_9FLAO|nr:DPP IV N-terminal domain-containing protein [Flavobacterium agricola]UYW02324.1 DPP IV N-terminal domain-containing protein [Flavobacterium agricola]